MLIYLTGSTHTVASKITVYRRIVQTIHEQGHGLTRDWAESARVQSALKGKVELDTLAVCREIIDATERAELVIVEASGPSSFDVGYQVAIALERRKPTLILVQKGDTQEVIASGLQHKLLSRKEYEPDALEKLDKIVADFIRQNLVSSKELRFNFVIDRKIYHHLRRKSFKTGKTKAEIVRDIVLGDIKSTED